MAGAGAYNDEYLRRPYDNAPQYNGYDLDRNIPVHVTPVTTVYCPTVTPPTQYPRAYGYDVMTSQPTQPTPQTTSSSSNAFPRFMAVGASTAPDCERYDDDDGEFVSSESSEESSTDDDDDDDDADDDVGGYQHDGDEGRYVDDAEDEYGGATQLNYLDMYYQVDILINIYIFNLQLLHK